MFTVQAKKTDYEMSSLEIENLLRQLKLELGIESNAMGETARKSKGKSEKTFLSQLLTTKTTKERTPALPPAPPHRKTLQEIKESDKKKQDDQKILDDLSEREIKELLKDASLGIISMLYLSFSVIHLSLDSDTVNSILGIINKDDESEGSTDSPKLFNNVNISSFNVSFNAGKKTGGPSGQEKQSSGRKKSTVLQRRVSERRDSR